MTQLEIALDRLGAVEQLLVRSTPQAINEVEALLRQAAAAVAEHRDSLSMSSAREDAEVLERFRTACDRVTKLLEGARRAQWIRMRLLASLTQTYTARAEGKTWSPPHVTVNVRM